MAGKKQHFIPRALLRGFAEFQRGTGRVWVTTRDQPPYRANTLDAAAARFFYTTPAERDDGNDLDGIITAHETHLADQITALRHAPIGQVADAGPPAQIVAHLYFRTAATRSLLSRLMLRTQEKKRELATPRVMLRFIGADGSRPTPRFEEFIDFLMAEPKWKASAIGIPRRVIRRKVFELAQKDPEGLVGPMARELAYETGFLEAEHPSLAREAHVGSLGSGVVPSGMADRLGRLSWTAEASADLPLPDTVALSSADGDRFQALAFGNPEDERIVVMPLASDRVLVGRRDRADGYELKPEMLRRAFISGADQFFVTRENAARPDEQALIGQSAETALSEGIERAFQSAMSRPFRNPA